MEMTAADALKKISECVTPEVLEFCYDVFGKSGPVAVEKRKPVPVKGKVVGKVRGQVRGQVRSWVRAWDRGQG